MKLYRLEAVADGTEVVLVIVANTEEEAFHFADIELEKHFLNVPQVEDLTMHELKSVRSGAGYVIER